MSFVHPWALTVGGLAATLPVLIHFLTRPKPRRFPLSTLRFVRQAVEQRKTRHRLRDFIVLMLRTAAILLLALAIARPRGALQPLVDPAAPGSAVRIVLVDVSQSMAADERGVQQFERARPIVAQYLAYQPDLVANVVFAGAGARAVFERPSTNLAALREEVRQATPLPERLNVNAALRRAGDLLAQIPDDAGVRRELVVVSDFQRTNWSAADFSPLPRDANIRLEYVADANRLGNLGILRCSSDAPAEVGRPVRLSIEVGNFSDAARKAPLEVRVGDLVQRVDHLCPPNSKSVVTIEALPGQIGWQMGEARLVGARDALPTDDLRWFVLRVRAPTTYALITRQPATLRPSSSYYVERALAPTATVAGGEKVTRLVPSRLERDSLVGSDVVVVDHPGKLPPAVISLLAEGLRRGRGVLYIAAEPADVDNLRALAAAAGSDLKLPVEFLPSPVGQARRDLFWTELRKSDAPFSIFGDGLDNQVRPLRFSGGLQSRRLDTGLTDDVLAHLSDRSASLVVTACGNGQLVVLNVDLGLSNLATSPVFVPLVGELVRGLRGRQTVEPPLASGESAALYLPADAGGLDGLRVIPPEMAARSPRLDAGELVAESSGVLWRWARVGPPGLYRVMKDNSCAFACASATPADESDLAAMPARLLEERLAGGRRVQARHAGQLDKGLDQRWAWLALACLGCWFGQLVALKVFRT